MSSDTETQQPSDGAENPESNVKKSMTSKIYEKLSSAYKNASNAASNTIDKFRTIEQLLTKHYTEVPIDENELSNYNSKKCVDKNNKMYKIDRDTYYIMDDKSNLYRKDVELYIADRENEKIVKIGKFTGEIYCIHYYSNPVGTYVSSIKDHDHFGSTDRYKKFALFLYNENGKVVTNRIYFYADNRLLDLNNVTRYSYNYDKNPIQPHFFRTYALKTDLAELDKTKAALDKTNATELDNTKAALDKTNTTELDNTKAALDNTKAALDNTKAALDKTNATELDKTNATEEPNTKAGSSYFKKRKGKNKKSKKNKKTKKNVTSYKKITHRQ
jgi:hypothetical protein